MQKLFNSGAFVGLLQRARGFAAGVWGASPAAQAAGRSGRWLRGLFGAPGVADRRVDQATRDDIDEIQVMVAIGWADQESALFAIDGMQISAMVKARVAEDIKRGSL